MPKHLYTYILLLLFSFPLFSQNILWADKVLSFSTERTDTYFSPKFRAKGVVGKPNVFPSAGIETPCAWTPSGSDFGEDDIKVGFDHPMKIKQIAISENLMPGSIYKISGFDTANQEHVLFENKEVLPKEKGRLWNIFLPETEFEVAAIKLYLDHARVKGMKQIDAIAISDSETPIEVKVNLAENINENRLLEMVGTAINSSYGELAPVISPDGRELFFTRLNHPENLHEPDASTIKQDIWYSIKKGRADWADPQNIGPPLNNTNDNAVACISADGKSLFVLNVYRKDGTNAIGLSRSRRISTGWAFPEKIEIDDFQALSHEEERNGKLESVTHTEFTLTSDEKVMIMGLKRNPTFGERDLYVAFRKPDGGYSKPINLGAVINTADMEGSPFIASDNKTLYFMSKGHLGYGNGDIFMSRRLDGTWLNWSEPQNLGKPINSTEWDGYINIPASSDYAYISAKKNKKDGADIFKVLLDTPQQPDPVALITGQVVETGTQKTIPARIIFKNLTDTTKITEELLYDPEISDFKTIVPIGKTYAVEVKEKGYFEFNDIIELKNDRKYREIREIIRLLPIREGQKVVLNNLYFEQAKYQINENSFDELNRIIRLMKEYPTMEVLLEGHTDNQGDLMKNVELAQHRVEEVRRFLVEKGQIEPGRIKIKSWGPTHPIASNATEESRKKNRRVEFTIIKL